MGVESHSPFSFQWYKRQVEIKEERDQKMQKQTTLNPVRGEPETKKGIDSPFITELALLSKTRGLLCIVIRVGGGSYEYDILSLFVMNIPKIVTNDFENRLF